MLNNPIIEINMITAFAKILMSEDISDKIRELRLSALKSLYSYLEYYEKAGYVDKLICNIAEKKITMIMQSTSKTEMNNIIKPHCPKYDGNKFISNEYSVLEEELIGWSETSLQAPLNEAGFNRYMELFKIVFPEKVKDVLHN